MLQSFGKTDGDLSRKVLAAGEYRRANDRGEARVDKSLTAYYREDAVVLRISLRFMHTVEVAASHIHPLSLPTPGIRAHPQLRSSIGQPRD